jgi:20S proteasome alpha/beta subunit
MKAVKSRLKGKRKVNGSRYLNKNLMTLIIGIRCKDGVVMAGDRRV